MTEYNDLVDQSILDRARALHDAATERLKEAEAELAKARQRHADAERAANVAAAGDSDTSPLDAEHSLADASVALASATRVHAAATERQGKTYKNQTVSEAVAWRGVAVDGARRMIAAAARHDEAHAMLKAAQEEYGAGYERVVAARGRGAALGQDNSNGIVRPLAVELAHWETAKALIDGGVAAWTSLPFGFIA